MVNCIVIDDHKDIVALFCDLLDMIDVEALATGNDGKEAVELYEKYHPDIVFTDLQMPNYDGTYAAENIKDKDPNAKIVLVTGNINAEQSLLFNLLNIPIVNKPFDMHTIKQVIADVILTGDDSPAPFKIQYKLKDDADSYSCIVTYEQYRNLKKLPIIEECNITSIEQNTPLCQDEMQKALDLAFKNDTSHIRKLSEIVG